MNNSFNRWMRRLKLFSCIFHDFMYALNLQTFHFHWYERRYEFFKFEILSKLEYLFQFFRSKIYINVMCTSKLYVRIKIVKSLDSLIREKILVFKNQIKFSKFHILFNIQMRTLILFSWNDWIMFYAKELKKHQNQ